MWICARNVVPGELFDFDVVLSYKVDRAILLADAAWTRCTLDCVRAFQYERSRFAREFNRECKNILQFCGAERIRHG